MPRHPPARRNSTISWISPRPADVIRYSYLWRHEAARGEDAGRKDRPCLVLAATPVATGLRVIIAPITSRRLDPAHTVPLPPRVAAHLGLDAGCGVVCNDLNRFIWVGPDVRATPNGTPYYGQVPARLYDEIRRRVLADATRPTDRTA
jgi:hypothetical protein